MSAVAGDGRPFVGRTETVDALLRRFEDARAGTGGVTLLVGGTGVGKSTLVDDLVRNMRTRETRVLVGRAPALDAPPPFALLRSALESAREATAADFVPGLPRPETFLIGFAPRLNDAALSAPVQIEERLLSALGEADERGESARDPVWSEIGEQFLEFTRRGPTVLVLEDLHRADEPSLEAVEYLARQLQNRPLWVVATARPFETLSPARRSRLEALEAATHARRIVLRPFTSDEVADYLRWREPDRDFSAEEVARRYSETGGNPLLLEQFDRRLVARPRPVGPDGPAGAEGPASASLLPLSEEEERALAVAAVLGPEFPFSLLLHASGEEEERLAESVDRLVNGGLLFERPGELLAFADDRHREEVYAHLTESRRRLLHRKAGEALEAMGAADLTTIYALARHFYLGRVDEPSLQYNRAAAEIADRAYSPEVAREQLERALESFRRLRPDDADGEAELLLEIAQQIDHLGELKEAEAYLRGHLERKDFASRLSPHIRALLELYLAQVLTDRGDWRAAEAETARVLASADLRDHPLVRVGLHRLRGEALYYEGRYPEALAEHTEELRLARESGNERASALGLVRRAYVLAMIGEAEGATAEARDAARILERLGDAREAAQAHLFLGVVIAGSASPAPRYAEAASEFAQAIRHDEKAHDARRVGLALFNSADILREAGRLDEAADRTRRAREILERMGDRFGLVQSMIVQGKIELDRGEYDRAEADLLDAYRLVRELRAPADEVDVVLRLAQLSYARGDRATARRRVAELERQNLRTLRPDVVADFERLQGALGPKEGEDAG